jgi:type VI secretion system protein ImpA
MFDAPLPELASLLEPISADDPIGVELKGKQTHPLLSEVRSQYDDARKAETSALQPVADAPGKAAPPPGDPFQVQEWSKLAATCATGLQSTSKDLFLTSRYAVALLRTNGLLGLAYGLDLNRLIIEHYWTNMVHRSLARLGATNAVAAMKQVVNDFVTALQVLEGEFALGVLEYFPMTATDAGVFTYFQCRHAVGTKDEPLEKQRYPIAQVRACVEATAKHNPAFYPSLAQQIDALETASRAFSGELEKTSEVKEAGAGDAAPTVVQRGTTLLGIAKRCVAMREVVADLAAPFLAAPKPEDNALPASTNGSKIVTGEMAAHSLEKFGTPRHRQEAFEQLSRIADFFRDTEPLSLLAEQIQQVVKRGKMTPQQYFEQLIGNDSARSEFFRLVGIHPEEKKNS